MPKNDTENTNSLELRDHWEVEWLPVDNLKPNPRTARTHPRKKIKQLARAITHFKHITPLIVDENLMIWAGHARAEAAKLIGLKAVPVQRVPHLTEIEKRALMLADNKLQTKAGWDNEVLAIEFTELEIALPEVNLDLTATGFELGEIEPILLNQSDSKPKATDEIPDVEEIAVAKTDEIYVLGPSRLAIGDARDGKIYERLMAGQVAEMAFLDPPYNVKIDGHVGGRGRIKHREFAHASGEMNSAQFIQFLEATLGQCAQRLADGAITFVCMDWRHNLEIMTAGATVYNELKNICVWAKTTPGQGSFYRSQHELVYVFKTGTAAHINTFELGQYGRTRSNVWHYPGVNMFRAGRMDELRMHPTVKPVALVVDAMRDCSRRGSIVLDAFCGSGTSIIAAEQIGRRAFCIEIDPLYADVAIRRWQRLTGKDATLESTGKTFDELAALRAGAALKPSV